MQVVKVLVRKNVVVVAWRIGGWSFYQNDGGADGGDLLYLAEMVYDRKTFWD